MDSKYLCYSNPGGRRGLLSFVFAIIVCTHNNAAMVLQASFIAKTFAVVVGTATGLIGALIGDAMRRFAHPSAFYTTGGMASIIWIRLFWLFGPQLIGMAIGTMLGVAIVLG